jgi:L-idonate 5-dehydrogenase
MPPIRAIFDVHFEASVNERAIRPDLDFLRPARRAAGAWGLHLRSPDYRGRSARHVHFHEEFSLAVDLINRRSVDMMGSTTCKRPSSLPVTTAAR